MLQAIHSVNWESHKGVSSFKRSFVLSLFRFPKPATFFREDVTPFCPSFRLRQQLSPNFQRCWRMTQDPIVQNAVVGWPCMYPHCKERRRFHIELVHHIESDHASIEELEGRIISDNKGRILALAPIILSRQFPEVGLPQEELTSLLQRRAGVPRPVPHAYSPQWQNAYPSPSTQSVVHPNIETQNGVAQARYRPQVQVQHPLLHDLLNQMAVETPSPPNSSQYDMPPALPVAHLPSLPPLKTPARNQRSSVSNVLPAYSPDSGRGSESSSDGSSFVLQAPVVAQKHTAGSIVDDDDDNSENSEDSDDGFIPVDAHFTAKRIMALSLAAAEVAGHGSGKFACPVPACTKILTSVNGMKYHSTSNMHQKKKPLRCEKCERKYYTTSEKLAEHSRHCTGTLESTPKTGKRTRNDSLKEDEGLVTDLPPSLPEPNSPALYSPSSKLHRLLTSSNNTSKMTTRKASKLAKKQNEA